MSAACLPSFAHGWRSLPQSVQTAQPAQRAECVGAPAQTRERALRAPSRDWLAWWCLTRRREPARPLRFASRSAGFATTPLRSRHISVARQARHRCASTASDAGLAALTESLAVRASRVGSRRRARPPRPIGGGVRLRGVAQAPALRLRCSFLRVWAFARDRAPAHADCRRGRCLTPAFPSAALHCAARLPANSTAGLPLLFVSFHSRKPPETGPDDARRLARCAYRVQANREGPRPRCV